MDELCHRLEVLKLLANAAARSVQAAHSAQVAGGAASWLGMQAVCAAQVVGRALAGPGAAVACEVVNRSVHAISQV